MAETKRLTILEELFAFEHTTFDICITYIGMLFAASVTGITLYKIILITVAFFAARSAAMIMNRYAGRRTDLQDESKGRRDSMVISRDGLIAIFMAFAAVFLVSAYLLNLLVLFLAPIVLLWFIVDPYLKTHTSHRHYDIGIMQGLGMFGGYMGASGAAPLTMPLYLLFIAIILIGGGSDIIYTVSHMEFDKKHGLKTYASKYGAEKALKYSLYSHVLAGLFMVLFGVSTGSWIIASGAIIAAVVLVSEHRGANYDSRSFKVYGIAHYKGYVGIILLLSVMIAFVTL